MKNKQGMKGWTVRGIRNIVCFCGFCAINKRELRMIKSF